MIQSEKGSLHNVQDKSDFTETGLYLAYLKLKIKRNGRHNMSSVDVDNALL